MQCDSPQFAGRQPANAATAALGTAMGRESTVSQPAFLTLFSLQYLPWTTCRYLCIDTSILLLLLAGHPASLSWALSISEHLKARPDQRSPQPAPHTLSHLLGGQGTAPTHTAVTRRDNTAGGEKKGGRISEKEKTQNNISKKGSESLAVSKCCR